jgi:2-hydroxychromene-2-carboxylate isomerase
MDGVVVYGDFANPLSRMASQLVDALVERGRAVTWRAVRGDGRHCRGSRVIGVACVRPGSQDPRHRLATSGSVVSAPVTAPLVAPSFDPTLAITALADADAEGDDAHLLRTALFRACWRDRRDLSDVDVVEALAHRPVTPPCARAQQWQRAWEGFAEPAVPLVLLPTGYVFREAEAIDELTRQLDAASSRVTGV